MRTAVILAARFERDTEIPYPLQAFHGNECLMDRTLAILNTQGYNHIVIVVGFKAEMFEKYRSDEVIVVYAPDFKYTSSMASLAAAKDFVKEDFLLIEGDVFFESCVVESLSVTNNPVCLAITAESGNGDEAFVETQHGLITKVSKDKHQLCNFEGELLGVCKISYTVFLRMLERWATCTNPCMNYEYMLMDCTTVLERPYVMFHDLIWGDVDNQDNFKRLVNYIYPKLKRKENPFDFDNIITYMSDIFPKGDFSSMIVEQIGGLTNKNFKITFHNRQYVLRVPGIGTEGIVNRINEESNSLLAASMGINPSIRYFNEQNGIKLTDYIPSAETMNKATIQRKAHLIEIADIYKKLHHSHVRFNNDFNVFHEIRHYENILFNCGGVMYAGYDAIRPIIMSFSSRLNELGVVLAPCHNDAVAENFIKGENGRFFLIDWEYSGMNDPVWEFAALFLESDFSEESKDLFLETYYNGDVPVVVKEKILLYQILQDILWSLWTCVKEKKGDDYGSYGIDRYKRALSELKDYENIYKLDYEIL